MAALDTATGRAGVKVLSDIPANAACGLPVQRSTILVASARTGECQAVLDGRRVTAVRTAAASAVATAHLARPDSSVLGLVGAGTLDGGGLRRARVVVDSVQTALAKSGEVVLALAENAIVPDDVGTELGAVIAGLAPGRTSVREVTLFNSVGIGLQDLVTADLLIARARARNVGLDLDLSA
ncbi:hypothetical protein [Cryptosporangium phraense]|uniref:hypothetical protein n=1 Tax=Cryptosporangium phraense TaxID=2593070 RepID=UPI00197ACA54|nr:hypothetical protein [Cryptosporangium phraense]